eukprot:1323947-Amorphochlora_amoeboformis.AAC.1
MSRDYIHYLHSPTRWASPPLKTQVVVADSTIKAKERAEKEGRSTWRVSSTLFAHIASDNTLEPIGKFSEESNAKNYPATKAGQQVSDELAAIKLA